MRIALISPHYYRPYHGNAVTARRLQTGLQQRGAEVIVIGLDQGRGTAFGGEDRPKEQFQEVERRAWLAQVDIVHGLHAWKTAPWLREARWLGRPTVVTLTGTDINHDLSDPDRVGEIENVLQSAATIVVYHEGARRALAKRWPALRRHIAVIPPGVVVPQAAQSDETGSSAARGAAKPEEDIIFFLPAGVRPVKNVLLPLNPLRRLRERGLRLRLLYAGAILERAEGERFREAIAGLSWVDYLGPLSPDEMSTAYEAAHVVLNTSVSEGLSNAILEGMAHGKAILASDIEGNRAVLQDGETGLLFHDERSFETRAEQLYGDRLLRERLGRAARATVRERFDPVAEIEAHFATYRRVLRITPDPCLSHG